MAMKLADRITGCCCCLRPLFGKEGPRPPPAGDAASLRERKRQLEADLEAARNAVANCRQRPWASEEEARKLLAIQYKITDELEALYAGIRPHTEAANDAAANDAMHRVSSRREVQRDADAGAVGCCGLCGQMRKEMAAMSQKKEQVLAEATRRITSSAALRQRLGDRITVLSPQSQSSQSRSVNGHTTQKISMVLPVRGGTGAGALAHVMYAAESGQHSSCSITVQMPEGDVVQVHERKGGDGEASDVEL